jgi:hypothetical protein
MHAPAGARFTEALKLRCPEGMLAAVAQVARRRHQTSSEYLRQLVLRDLQQEGVMLSADSHSDTAGPA